LEHVVDGGEDRGGDRHDRLLGASLRFDAVELGVEIAVFFAHRCPGALHQCGLEPGRSLANARGAALAGALIAARADTRPGNEIGIAGKAAHVYADLGEDLHRSEGFDTRHRTHLLDGGAKGRNGGLHLPVDSGNGGIERDSSLTHRFIGCRSVEAGGELLSTLRVRAGERLLARKSPSKARTAGTVSFDSLVEPKNGSMCCRSTPTCAA